MTTSEGEEVFEEEEKEEDDETVTFEELAGKED